jgi:hypothetical protein
VNRLPRNDVCWLSPAAGEPCRAAVQLTPFVCRNAGVANRGSLDDDGEAFDALSLARGTLLAIRWRRRFSHLKQRCFPRATVSQPRRRTFGRLAVAGCGMRRRARSSTFPIDVSLSRL